MAATNSTTNYGLPQWVATDKPEMTDFNTAMSDIDTSIKFAQEDIAKNICKIILTTDQSIPKTTVTKINFDTVKFDTNSMADIANNSIICKKTGIYEISGHYWSESNSGGIRNVYLFKNGTILTGQGIASVPAHNFGNNIIPFNTFLELNENDYITVSVYQSSSSSLLAQGDSQGNKTNLVLSLI